MKTIHQLTMEDLDYMIEKKVLEILGDPDLGLELKKEFREELENRLLTQKEKIPHEEVLKRFG